MAPSRKGALGAVASEFAWHQLSASRQVMGEGNLAVSPLSLIEALLVYAESCGKDGDRLVSDLLERCLGQEVRAHALSRDFVALHDGFRCASHATVEEAVAFYYNMGLGMSVDASVEKRLARAFGAKVEAAAFGSERTDNMISHWVAEKTRGKLRPSFQFGGDLVAVIVSVLYAKLSWHHPFVEALNKEDDFFCGGGGTTRVTYMNATLTGHAYHRGDGYTKISLPFDGGFAMDFVMPDDPDGLGELLGDVDRLGDAFAKDCCETANVELSLPKFDIMTQGGTNKVLRRMGFGDLYEEGLPCALCSGYPVQVSKVSQATRLTLDEQGIEGAAFTVVELMCGGLATVDEYPTIEIRLDRPFAFCIRTDDGVPLFSGTFVG